MTPENMDLSVPPGAVLRNTGDGTSWTVETGVLLGGGYYIIRQVVTGEQRRLNPTWVGTRFQRQPADDLTSPEEP